MSTLYYDEDEDKKYKDGRKDEDYQGETIINEIWYGIRIKIVRLPDNYIGYQPSLN